MHKIRCFFFFKRSRPPPISPLFPTPTLSRPPIINPPQSAILGVHATKERAVVENGQIVIRPMNYLAMRSEEHTSELQSRLHLVCRLLLEKKKNTKHNSITQATGCHKYPPTIY